MNERMNENAGYIVRFVRRDGRPDEEYYYNQRIQTKTKLTPLELRRQSVA